MEGRFCFLDFFTGHAEHQSSLTILIKKRNYKLLIQKLFILKIIHT